MPFRLPQAFCRTFFHERGVCPVFLFCSRVEIFYNGKMTACLLFRLLTVLDVDGLYRCPLFLSAQMAELLSETGSLTGRETFFCDLNPQSLLFFLSVDAGCCDLFQIFS